VEEAAMAPISVLIVDDHAIARLGLRAMLESDPQVQVVGEASSGAEALERTEQLQPSVVLMDIKMPNMDGLETTRLLKNQHPATSVIILTNHDEEAMVVEAVRVGAGGYLLKDASRDLLVSTIGAVVSGGILIEAPLLRKALGNYVNPGTAAERRRPTSQATPGANLGERELVIIAKMAEGQTNKEIADALGLAEVTVKKQVQGIIAKLRASDRTHATITALRLGIIS